MLFSPDQMALQCVTVIPLFGIKKKEQCLCIGIEELNTCECVCLQSLVTYL